MRPVEGTITDPRMDRYITPPSLVADEPLTLDEYQEKAASTAIYPRVYTEEQVKEMVRDLFGAPDYVKYEGLEKATDLVLDKYETEFNRLVYPVLGLVGEAGEVANKLKKVARDNRGEWAPWLTQDYESELGDCDRD